MTQASRTLAAISPLPGVIDLGGNGIAARRAFGTHHLKLNVSVGGLGPRRTFGTHRLDLNVTMGGGLGPRRVFGSHTVTGGPVTIGPFGNLGPRREFGTHAVRRTISVPSIGPRRVFGSHTVTPGNVNVAPASLGPRRAFGAASLARQMLVGDLGPRRVFGSHRVKKTDLAEQRRQQRVAAGTEFEDDPLRRFFLLADVDGSFAYGPRGRGFDFDAELRENEIQTADYSVSEGIEATGQFAEVEPVI